MNSTGTESFKIPSPQRRQTLLLLLSDPSVLIPQLTAPPCSCSTDTCKSHEKLFFIFTLMKNTPMHFTPCKTWKFILITLFFNISPNCNVSNFCGLYIQSISGICLLLSSCSVTTLLQALSIHFSTSEQHKKFSYLNESPSA